jgi:hypothetical protein
MNTFLHDIDLGPKPDAHNQRRILSNGRESELLLTILHYLRDESMARLGDATDALRNGQEKTAHMEMGAHEWLVQAFTKINDLRNAPMEIEAEVAA